MSESKRRACLACGGTCGLSPFTEDGFYCPDNPNGCPACDGRGWQSDQMPASDAIADAETLRLARTLAPYQTWLALQAAAFCGRSPVLFMDPTSEHAWEIGRDAARAAFRAVPGLRG